MRPFPFIPTSIKLGARRLMTYQRLPTIGLPPFNEVYNRAGVRFIEHLSELSENRLCGQIVRASAGPTSGAERGTQERPSGVDTVRLCQYYSYRSVVEPVHRRL